MKSLKQIFTTEYDNNSIVDITKLRNVYIKIIIVVILTLLLYLFTQMSNWIIISIIVSIFLIISILNVIKFTKRLNVLKKKPIYEVVIRCNQ